MAQVEYLSYDEAIDHLTIYKADEKIFSTMDTGLVLISLNKKGEIVGLEFMGAQKNFHIPEEVLKWMRGCRVEIEYKPDTKFLIVKLTVLYKKEERPIVYSSAHLDLGESPFTEKFACSATA